MLSEFQFSRDSGVLGSRRLGTWVAFGGLSLSVSEHSVWDFSGLRNTNLCSEHSLVFKHKKLTCVQTQRPVFEHKALWVAVCSLCLAVFFEVCLWFFLPRAILAVHSY